MRSLFETPPEHPFYRFWSTFGVHLGTLWNHFFNTFFDLIFRPPFEPKNKPVLAMEREARRKLKLCFINVLELRLFPVRLPLQGSACALCVLCVCSVWALLLSGLPGQEAKLNIKSTKNISKTTTKIIDFRSQHRRFWDPF